MPQPIVIAHRGASAAFPENTVEAFHGARSAGADWVELDARRTADGASSFSVIFRRFSGLDLPESARRGG